MEEHEERVVSFEIIFQNCKNIVTDISL